MNTIKECFNIILRGNQTDSRLAARRVRKLLYGSRIDREGFEYIADVVSNAPGEYVKIFEEWRKENFVVAISVIYYLHNKKEPSDFLFQWFFQLLQHPSGIIRYASVRMLHNEIGPLTVYIRCPEYKAGYFGKLTKEQSDVILYSLFMSLTEQLSIFWQPKYGRYKYINSLPASPYKSVQMVLAQLEEHCGKKYLDNLVDHFLK